MLAAKLDCYLGATSSSKEKTEKDFTLSLRMVLLFLCTYMPFSCYPQENVVGSPSKTFIEQESPNSMHNICTNAEPCPLLANLEPLPETSTLYAIFQPYQQASSQVPSEYVPLKHGLARSGKQNDAPIRVACLQMDEG